MRAISRLAAALAIPLALSSAACRSDAPRASDAVPGVTTYPGSLLAEAQPTASEGVRVERWRLPVPGGDEPARVAAERDAVLAHYADALAAAGYVLRSDGDASLRLYAGPDGCTAYVSAIVDPAEPDVLLVELGRATEGCGTPSPAPR